MSNILDLFNKLSSDTEIAVVALGALIFIAVSVIIVVKIFKIGNKAEGYPYTKDCRSP